MEATITHLPQAQQSVWRKLLNYKIGPLPLPLYLAISLITIAAALNKKLPNDMIGGFAVLIVLSAIGLLMHGAMRYAARRYIFWIRRNEAPVMA